MIIPGAGVVFISVEGATVAGASVGANTTVNKI